MPPAEAAAPAAADGGGRVCSFDAQAFQRARVSHEMSSGTTPRTIPGPSAGPQILLGVREAPAGHPR
jgi:hypothetical protein